MDPLSISASVVALIQAANFVSTSLTSFIRSVKQADARLLSLSAELNTLTGFLEAVDKTLKQCQDQNILLSPVDEEVWHQSASALEDCQTSLAELECLVIKITSKAQTARPWRSTKLAFDLNSHARTIEGLQDKIHKSTRALHTIMAVFNVSLSLRGNASQDIILTELARLKFSVEQSLFAAMGPDPGPPRTNTARNLQNLARAANHFHSTASTKASTTASTVYMDQTEPYYYGQYASEATPSVVGDMPAFRRERIEQFLQGNPGVPTRQASRSSGHQFPDFRFSESQGAREKHEPTETDADADLELLFQAGYEKMAIESARRRDFPKASTLLEKALDSPTARNANVQYRNKLQTQLAICYIFQEKWEAAESLVQQLACSNQEEPSLAIAHLLHALAMRYLEKFSFDMAFKLCKQALSIKKRLQRTSHDQYCHCTMGLLAVIYDVSGEPVRSRIIKRSIPAEHSYEHPADPLTYLSGQTGVFKASFGEDVTTAWTRSNNSSNEFLGPATALGDAHHHCWLAEGPDTYYKLFQENNLLEVLDEAEKYELDTGKEVFIECCSEQHEHEDTAMVEAQHHEQEEKENDKEVEVEVTETHSRASRLARAVTVLKNRPWRRRSLSGPLSDREDSSRLSGLARRESLKRWLSRRRSTGALVETRREQLGRTRQRSFNVLSVRKYLGSDFEEIYSADANRNAENSIEPAESRVDVTIPAELMDTSAPVERAELYDTGLSHIDVLAQRSHDGQACSADAVSLLSSSSNICTGTSRNSSDETMESDSEVTDSGYSSGPPSLSSSCSSNVSSPRTSMDADGGSVSLPQPFCSHSTTTEELPCPMIAPASSRNNIAQTGEELRILSSSSCESLQSPPRVTSHGTFKRLRFSFLGHQAKYKPVIPPGGYSGPTMTTSRALSAANAHKVFSREPSSRLEISPVSSCSDRIEGKNSRSNAFVSTALAVAGDGTGIVGLGESPKHHKASSPSGSPGKKPRRKGKRLQRRMPPSAQARLVIE